MIDRIKKLKERLEALKLFPNNKEVKILRVRIKKQLARLEKKQPKEPKVKQTRSGKLRRYHNYIRQIRNNYPDLSYNEIRAQLVRRRKRKPSKIPDAIWQNPSP